MTSFGERADALLRLVVLQVLSAAAQEGVPDLNDAILRSTVSEFGPTPDAERLRLTMNWLAEAGLLTVREAGPFPRRRADAPGRRRRGRAGDCRWGQATGLTRVPRAADPAGSSSCPRTSRPGSTSCCAAGVTQKAILAHLAPLLEAAGEKPLSAGGLNRYATRMEAVGRRVREAREMASVWTAKLGETPTANIGAYTLEMLRTLVYDLTLRAHEGEELDVEQLEGIALTLQRIERASKLNTDRERALRRELAEIAADAATGAARRKGVSAETAAEIRSAIEGAVT